MTSYKYPNTLSSSSSSLSSNSSFHNDYGYSHSELSTSLASDLLSSYTPSMSGIGATSGLSMNGESEKPRILLMGLRRSGKSSIQKVVFQKMSPHETLFLESTNKIVKNGKCIITQCSTLENVQISNQFNICFLIYSIFKMLY